MFGLHKLYSKQSLLRFLWKKVHRLEKSTPTPLVALQTNMSYGMFFSSIPIFLDRPLVFYVKKEVFNSGAVKREVILDQT